MWEQLEIAAQYQHYWADNSVSITVTFNNDEAPQIKDALELYESRLKAVSFLRYQETGYEQAPYEPITEEQYNKMTAQITPLQRISTNEEGVGSKYCTNDTCEINFGEKS
jgi:ribonucleoside-triphosphate reductase